MSSLLTSALKVLHAGVAAAGGEPITYRRGNNAIEGLVLTPAAPRVDDYGDELASVSTKALDWIAWAAELVFPGNVAASEPAQNDEIDRRLADGSVRTYRVRPTPDGRPFRPTADPPLQLRIHAVEVRPNVNA